MDIFSRKRPRFPRNYEERVCRCEDSQTDAANRSHVSGVFRPNAPADSFSAEGRRIVRRRHRGGVALRTAEGLASPGLPQEGRIGFRSPCWHLALLFLSFRARHLSPKASGMSRLLLQRSSAAAGGHGTSEQDQEN